MNVLVASRGSIETLAQKSCHKPSLPQILLDVRQIERRRPSCPAASDRRRRRRIAFGPAKLPTTGTIRLRLCRPFTKREPIFASPRKPQRLALAVGRGHQRRVGRLHGAARQTLRRVPDARTEHEERAIDVLDAAQIVAREQIELVRGEQPIADSAISSRCRAARSTSTCAIGVEDLGRRSIARSARRARPREQPRHELGAVRRQLEQRLVQQVQIQIAAPDVDDERHRRLERAM